MIYIEAIMLACLLFFGGYCTITDLRRGIVPNKLIVYGLLGGIVLHIVLLFCGAAPYYPYWLLNMAIADVIALGMYMGKMWAAGDAKLFMLLYFLIPPRLLDSDTLSHSIVPYIFIFVPALLWMAGDSLVRIIRKEAWKRERFSFKSFFSSFLCIVIETTAFHGIWTWLFPELIERQALLFAALMLVYAYICGTFSVMKRWYVVAAHGLVIVVLWICNQWSFSLPPWTTYLIMATVLILQRFCSMYNYQLVQTSQVKAGMIPATETVLLFQKSRVRSLPTDPSEELTAKITDEEAAAIRRWEKTANGKPSIWFVRKVPFAIMIYLGFIAWMLFRILGR